MATTYTLPLLPYDYNALEPQISEQIMKLHHSKHHQAYITNLNNALTAQSKAISSSDLVGQIYNQRLINFHAGGHINHTLFWNNLTPSSSPASKRTCASNLTKAIEQQYSSISSFIEKFTTTLLAIQGSGWGWLVQDTVTGTLDIVTTRDQDLVPKGKKPIFGIDMWEHAYYLQYMNDKAGYAKGIWEVINWEVAEKRFSGSENEVFGELGGLRAVM